MAKKPEQLVVNKLKRDLKKFADEYCMPLKIDKPPAGTLNSAGRPDLFVDLGPFHIRIEVKAGEKKKLSALQERYFKEQFPHDPFRCHLVKGKDGVDRFILGLPTLLDSMSEDMIKGATIWQRRIL